MGTPMAQIQSSPTASRAKSCSEIEVCPRLPTRTACIGRPRVFVVAPAAILCLAGRVRKTVEINMALPHPVTVLYNAEMAANRRRSDVTLVDHFGYRQRSPA